MGRNRLTDEQTLQEGEDGLSYASFANRAALSNHRASARRWVPLLRPDGGRARRPARLGSQSAGRRRGSRRGGRSGIDRAIRAIDPPRASRCASRACGRGTYRSKQPRQWIPDQMNTNTLKTKIRHVPDFPKAGILFYDITTLLQDPAGLRAAIDGLSLPFTDQGIDIVVGIESRGFIFGAAVADRIGAGFTPVRKPGKLPSKCVRASYDLEYGSDAVEIHEDAVRKGQPVLT